MMIRMLGGSVSRGHMSDSVARGCVQLNTVTTSMSLLRLRAPTAFVCLRRCLIQASRGRHKPVRCGAGAACFFCFIFFIARCAFLATDCPSRGVQCELLIFLNSGRLLKDEAVVQTANQLAAQVQD